MTNVKLSFHYIFVAQRFMRTFCWMCVSSLLRLSTFSLACVSSTFCFDNNCALSHEIFQIIFSNYLYRHFPSMNYQFLTATFSFFLKSFVLSWNQAGFLESERLAP